MSSNKLDGDGDGYGAVIAADSAGIKVTNRGQWVSDRWNAQNKKKGHLKIHVEVNTKTGEIPALGVTDEGGSRRQGDEGVG